MSSRTYWIGVVSKDQQAESGDFRPFRLDVESFPALAAPAST